MDTKEWRKRNPERWKQINKRSYLKNRDKNLEKFRSYYRDNREKLLERARIYREGNRKKLCELSKQRYHRLAFETKKKVFTHYGANGRMRCCWHACKVRDIDMLSLDHVNGNGSSHRKKVGRGFTFYRWIIRNKFPEGFQTLCMNHQMKKEAMRRRGEC